MSSVAETADQAAPANIDFQTEPQRYRHWRLSFDGNVATLAMDVNEMAPLAPG